MPRALTQFTRLSLVQLEDRLAPASFSVNDPGSLGDSDLTDGKAATKNGTVTLQAVFDHINKVGGSHTINFSLGGPATINGSFSYTKGALTINGTPGANGPDVKISGGLSLKNGNTIRDLYLTGAGVGLLVENNNKIINNVISGNSGYGIMLQGSGNKVTGNIVGLDAEGKSKQANGDGIIIFGSSNTIGGTSSSDRNFISGNTGDGIRMFSSSGPYVSNNNVIIGNYIGLSKDGSKNLPNGDIGVALQGNSNRVGGTSTAERNFIVSAGGGDGAIEIRAPYTGGSGTKIINNFIGTKTSGNGMFTPEADDPGAGFGVRIDGSEANLTNTIVQNNVIADFDSGIEVKGGKSMTGTQIVGNKLGIGTDGSTKVRNGNGIDLYEAKGITIGGTSASNKNIISANKTSGISLDQNSNDNRIVGNYIGTNDNGDDLGNGVHGVHIISGSNNKIGAVSDGKNPNNIIAFNGFEADAGKNERGHAIQIDDGNNNIVRLNSIYGNKGLALWLLDSAHFNEVPQNDTGRYDAATGSRVQGPDTDSGPNGLQNHPVVRAVMPGKITWEINSKPNTSYTLDFYGDEEVYDLGYGQGKTAFTTLTVTTDKAGHAEATIAFSSSQRITATATGPEGTSTFSIVDSDADGLADGWESKGGIDFDMDGTLDSNTLGGANPQRKDIFIEADHGGSVPEAAVAGALQTAFGNAPGSVWSPGGGGVGVHIRWGGLSGAPATLNNLASDVQGIRNASFGDGLSDMGKKAHAMSHRYAIFVPEGKFVAPGRKAPGETGFAESGTLLYDGKIVRFGGDTLVIGINSADPRDYQGTLMHELGHTLGLMHGGTDDVNYKPNHFSVMNYLWQLPNGLQQENKSVTGTYDAGWFLDYSRGKSPAINEASGRTAITLTHPTGGQIPVSNRYEVTVGRAALASPLLEPAWRLVNSGQPFTPLPAGRWAATGRVDLNGDGIIGTLTGSIDEWAVLQFNFRESSTYGSTYGAADAGLIRRSGGQAIGAAAVENIVVGADTGSEPRVKVYGPDGNVLFDFLAFDIGFTGGVRVAKGDVTGDGIADIIAAQGPGGGTVKIYDGVSGSLLHTVTPLGAAFTGGVNVAAGDLTGDGRAELFAAPASGTGSTVKALDLATMTERFSIQAYTATTTTGVTIAAGDVNKDGKADIITAPASGVNPAVKVFSGATGKQIGTFTESLSAYNGAYLASADVNGDGYWDIITSSGGGPSTKNAAMVVIHSGKALGSVLGAFIVDDPAFRGGARVAAVKLATGGYDIVTATGLGEPPHVRRFSSRTGDLNWTVDPLASPFNGAFVG